MEVKMGDMLKIKNKEDYYTVVRCGNEAVRIEEFSTDHTDADWLFDLSGGIERVWFIDELDEQFEKVSELKKVLMETYNDG